MLYLDTPTMRDLSMLNTVRDDMCVSIYLPTTPVTQQVEQSRIEFSNLVRKAIDQLKDASADKRRLLEIEEHLLDLADDDEFWRYQANSLAVFATPETLRTYRLANKLVETSEVSDRFHLKPLIRSITFPHSAYVLALSENAVRLVAVTADLPAYAVKVPDLPVNAASAVGKASIRDRSPSGRVQGREGQKTRLAQYIRKIDAALRPILAHSDLPVILAATQPLESLFRSTSSITALAQTISGSHDHSSEAELASAATPILDVYYAEQLAEFRRLFEQRTGQNRTTTDISDAARAATFGNIDTLLIDIDNVVNGYVDDVTGAVSFEDKADAKNYGIVDEIAGRALSTGARVLGVRKADIPAEAELAAILRSPL